MDTIRAFFIWLYFIISFSWIRKPISNFKGVKIGYRLEEADKELSWFGAEKTNGHTPDYLAVTIGPHMPWPQIQQIFRLAKNHSENIFLTIDGNPWNNELLKLKDSYIDWIISLFNRFEVPNNVRVFQILDETSAFTQLGYLFFLESVIYIDQSKINQVNRMKLTYKTIGNSTSYDQVTFNRKLENYIFEQKGIGYPDKWYKFPLWFVSLYKKIKGLCEVNRKLKNKNAYLLSSASCRHEKGVSAYLAKKVFGKKLKAVIFQ